MSDFISAVKDGAIESYRQHGILPSVSIAQAILESGWGKSELAVKAKNLFGIKAGSGWTGKTMTVPTKEWDGSKMITVNATFRAYKSWAECIVDHGAFFTSTPWRVENYKNVRSAKDYKQAAYALKAAGYATDPDYANKLIEVIERNQLQKYDRGAEKVVNHVGVNSSYQYITDRDARNFTTGRGGQKVNAIIIHHWNDPSAGSTFDGVVSWFCDNPACQNSAHYVVEGGRVACVVDPHNTAYHAGNWLVNQQSLGIECSPYQTDADYETAGELVADLWLEWGKLPLKRHRDVSDSPTACPGTWDLGRIQEIAERHFTVNPAAPEPEGPSIIVEENKPSEWAAKSWKEATEKGIIDGTRPKDNLTREEYAASELRRIKSE